MRDRTLECVRKNLCDRGGNGAKALRLEQAWCISGVSSVAGGGCQRSRAGVHKALQAIVGICILFCVHWETLSKGKLFSGFMLKKKSTLPKVRVRRSRRWSSVLPFCRWWAGCLGTPKLPAPAPSLWLWWSSLSSLGYLSGLATSHETR